MPRLKNPDPMRYVFHGDRWKGPKGDEFYEFDVRRVPRANDVNVALKLMRRNGCIRTLVDGWPSHVAPYFKRLAHYDRLKPVRRPAKDRIGLPHFELWW